MCEHILLSCLHFISKEELGDVKSKRKHVGTHLNLLANQGFCLGKLVLFS